MIAERPDEAAAGLEAAALCARIIDTYDDPVVRAYSRVRFQIINRRILAELAQYIPRQGLTIDLGCGFGLFSAYFSLLEGDRRVIGVDTSERRIALARTSAERLGLARRTRYQAGDARYFPDAEPADCIVTLDLLHHLPEVDAAPLLRRCHQVLKAGGRLVVKDVTTRPRPKIWFTWALDWLMAPGTPLCYRSRAEMTRLLEGAGFDVYSHGIDDLLPYPHILYVCHKRS